MLKVGLNSKREMFLPLSLERTAVKEETCGMYGVPPVPPRGVWGSFLVLTFPAVQKAACSLSLRVLGPFPKHNAVRAEQTDKGCGRDYGVSWGEAVGVSWAPHLGLVPVPTG